MAKFHGVVGYGTVVKTSPGVFETQIVERTYFGDVQRSSRGLRADDKVNDDITVNTTISIVADEYANEHFFAIRFVEWAGALWKVEDVDPQHPRLLLRLGGIYNGERQEVGAPDSP